MTETIYRIENEHGTGVYQTGVRRILYKHGCNWGDHAPSPHVSGEPFARCNPFAPKTYGDMSLYYFGFESLDQMFAWFPLEAVLDLISEGLHVVTYQIPFEDVAFGNKQVAFKRGDHTRTVIDSQIQALSPRHADASDRVRRALVSRLDWRQAFANPLGAPV